jgi:hypothetical protein
LGRRLDLVGSIELVGMVGKGWFLAPFVGGSWVSSVHLMTPCSLRMRRSDVEGYWGAVEALGESGHGAESVPSRELEDQREDHDARSGEKCTCCIVLTLSFSNSF